MRLFYNILRQQNNFVERQLHYQTTEKSNTKPNDDLV